MRFCCKYNKNIEIYINVEIFFQIMFYKLPVMKIAKNYVVVSVYCEEYCWLRSER